MGKMFGTDPLPKRYRKANKHLKSWSLSLFIREINFKSQWHIYQSCSNTKTILSAGENVEKRELSYTDGGIQRDTATPKTCLAVKFALAKWSPNPIPGIH